MENAITFQTDEIEAPFGESPKEECGVIGVFGRGEDVARIGYFGLFALQHRGQESAGLAVSDGERIRVHKDMGLVTQVFDEATLHDLRGHIAIGHTRYSTTGSSVIRNAQPLCCTSVVGDVAVAHNGNLVNTTPLREYLEVQGVHFETTNDSEVIAQLLAHQHTDTIEDAVVARMQKLKGAYSLTILTRDKLIGVRDAYGVRPLCVGKLDGGGYVLASETCALNVVGARFIREVEPGEVVVIDDQGMREIQAVPTARNATCLFEFIYFARPDSQMYGKTLHAARQRMGHELAREHPCPDAHIVVPIPDSAIPAALGFAQAARIPYAEGVVKNRYIQRTFIQPDQRMRELGARMKYTPLREALAGKKIVMVDDSIVRGTTTGKLVRMLFDSGAAEVHVRISAPPVRHPCFYGIDMANQSELVAYKHSVEEIRRMIGATSLGFLSLKGVVRAVGLGKDKFCRACFDGDYPIAVPPDVKVTKLMLEEPDRRMVVGLATATVAHDGGGGDQSPDEPIEY
jgi:amidophosphoribosyltransferase